MLTIPKQSLLSAISAVVEVCSEQAEATSVVTLEGALTLKATNFNEWLSIVAPDAVGELERCQVSASTLQSVTQGIRGDVLKLSIADNALHIAGKGKRKIALVQQPVPELPATTGPTVTMQTDKLQEAIAFTAANVCEDASKMGGALMGVHFHTIDGTLRAVSVSGNSCAAIDMQPCADEVEATLGKAALGLVKHICASVVDVTFGERLVSIRWPSGEVVAKRVEGKFADYMRAMPTHATALHVSADELKAGLKAVAAVAADDKAIGSKRTLLHLGSQEDGDGFDAAIVAQAQGKEGREPIDCEWSGHECKVAVAARIMSNVLSGFTGELEVGITPLGDGAPMPLLFRQKGAADRFGFMMPLRSA